MTVEEPFGQAVINLILCICIAINIKMLLNFGGGSHSMLVNILLMSVVFRAMFR